MPPLCRFAGGAVQGANTVSGKASPWTVVTNSSEARAWADDALNYERIPAACKIPGSIRSDCYKAQVAGTSSLPRCLYASGPRAVALYRVTPGEEFAPARRLVPRDSH